MINITKQFINKVDCISEGMLSKNVTTCIGLSALFSGICIGYTLKKTTTNNNDSNHHSNKNGGLKCLIISILKSMKELKWRNNCTKIIHHYENGWSPVDAVRRTTLEVMKNAKHVQINDNEIDKFAQELIDNEQQKMFNDAIWDDEGWHYTQDVETKGSLTCQFLFVVDALNFCFWPTSNLEYEQLATGLRDTILKDNTAFDAEKLKVVTNGILQR